MHTTLAQQFGALVVFAEHRYFGQSFPFLREDAFKYPNNKYLTVDNTMMDYVEVVKAVKAKWAAEDKAVIAFGGSYGGMLAAWLRMKHPQSFQGALAASAPILSFKGGASEDAYSNVATETFAGTFKDKRCSLGIKEGFTYLMALKGKTDQYGDLK